MRFASILNPNRTPHLLPRFIRKIEISSRIEAEATASRKERSGDGGDGGGGAGGGGSATAVVEAVSGGGSAGLPERKELPHLSVGPVAVGDSHRFAGI